MQLKLIPFTLFSLALLARASSPYDEDTLEAREWDEDLVERGYDAWDTIDARDVIDNFVDFDARSGDGTDLEDFTTRELLDELTDRLFEARAPPSSRAGRKSQRPKGKNDFGFRSETMKSHRKQATTQTPGVGSYTAEQNSACRKARGYDCNQRGAKITPGPGTGGELKPLGSQGPQLDSKRLLAAQQRVKKQWSKTVDKYKVDIPTTLRRSD